MTMVKVIKDMKDSGSVGDILKVGNKQAEELIAHGLAELVDNAPSAKTEATQLAGENPTPSIPDETTETNPIKRLAIILAKAVLAEEMELTTITTYVTFAEAEGIIGVTKGIAGIARGLVQREHKRRAAEWEGEEREKGPSIATRMVEMVLESDMKLFCDDGGKPYAWILKDGHHEIWPIDSKRFKQHIGMFYREEHNKVANASAIRDVVREISAEAWTNGPVYKIYNRVAWHDSAIWYDLTNSKYEVVRIDKNGWKILPKTPIPLFCRFDHQLPQVYPTNSEDQTPEQLLAILMKLMRFHNHNKDANKILDITSLVFSLVPDVPHPAIIVYGPAGSGKTRGFHATQRKLMDPSNMEMGVSWPSKGKEGNIPIQFQRHYNLIYSNISWISREMADHLCRAIDGAANETRKLYSDDEMVSFRYQRCIGINAIPIVATQEDLIDRSLLFETDPIAAEDRLDEEELDRLFEEVRPEILGAMFDALSAAMKIYPDINLGYVERMGSFSKWGVSITQALGLPHSTFTKAYATNRATAIDEVVDANIVARVTKAFMEDRAKWEGTPKEFHIELTAFEFGIGEKSRQPPKSWPKDESQMGKKLKRMKDPLMKIGIIVESRRTGRKRTMVLTWRENYGPESTQTTIDDAIEEETSGDSGDTSDGTLLLNRIEGSSSGKVEGREVKKKESPVTPVTPSPDEKASKKKKPLPQVVKQFHKWLEKLPNAGQRGFTDADIKKTYGEGYVDDLSKWEGRGWVEQRKGTLVWWISDEGKLALAGGPQKRKKKKPKKTLSREAKKLKKWLSKLPDDITEADILRVHGEDALRDDFNLHIGRGFLEQRGKESNPELQVWGLSKDGEAALEGRPTSREIEQERIDHILLQSELILIHLKRRPYTEEEIKERFRKGGSDLVGWDEWFARAVAVSYIEHKDGRYGLGRAFRKEEGGAS